MEEPGGIKTTHVAGYEEGRRIENMAADSP